MALEFIAANGGSSTGAGHPITMPQGMREGDLVYVFFAQQSAGGGFTPPAGQNWVVDPVVLSGGQCCIFRAFKYVEADEPATHTFSFSASKPRIGAVILIRGAIQDTTSPPVTTDYAPSGSAGGENGQLSVSTIATSTTGSTAVPGCLVLTAFAGTIAAALQPDPSDPAEAVNVILRWSSTDHICMLVAMNAVDGASNPVTPYPTCAIDMTVDAAASIRVMIEPAEEDSESEDEVDPVEYVVPPIDDHADRTLALLPRAHGRTNWGAFVEGVVGSVGPWADDDIYVVIKCGATTLDLPPFICPEGELDAVFGAANAAKIRERATRVREAPNDELGDKSLWTYADDNSPSDPLALAITTAEFWEMIDAHELRRLGEAESPA